MRARASGIKGDERDLGVLPVLCAWRCGATGIRGSPARARRPCHS